MRSTSRLQFDATVSGAVPGLERVRDDVWALGQPMPGERLGFSLLYLLRDDDGQFHVIDPGTDGEANLARLAGALAELGSGLDAVATITATHLHADHLGLGPRLRRATGARLRVHAAEASALDELARTAPTRDGVTAAAARWRVPEGRVPALLAMLDRTPPTPPETPVIDAVVQHGERLDIPGFDLVALHTPGHTSGHLCLHDAARGIVFTGDHVLPTVVSGLGLGGPTSTNALADFLASIETVLALGDIEALPGHGYRFDGLPGRAAEAAEHHLRRTREVAALDPALGVWETASRLTWTDGFAALDGFTLWSALAQTEMHRAYVDAGGSLDGVTLP